MNVVRLCPKGHPYEPRRDGRGKLYCYRCDRNRLTAYRIQAAATRPPIIAKWDALSRVWIPSAPMFAYFDREQISPRATFHPSVYRQIERSRHRGYITLGYADDLFGLLGVHPSAAWGPDWFAYGEEAAS